MRKETKVSRILGEQIRDTSVIYWVSHKGDSIHMLEHFELCSESLVIDLGGYKGEWAKKIFDRYGCFIDIYEPASEFMNTIRSTFRNELNTRINVHESAIGSSNNRVSLVMDGLGTRTIKDEKGEVKTISISDAISGRNVDLLKMNIEGDEYDVFDSIFENDLSKNLKSILVKFHPIDDLSIRRYAKIEQELIKTHECVFRYPFIWEKWRIK